MGARALGALAAVWVLAGADAAGAATGGSGGNGDAGAAGGTGDECSTRTTCFERCTCAGATPSDCLQQCTGMCGNGVIEAGEVCDGTSLNGAMCATVTAGARLYGVLTCSATCTFDTTGCTDVGAGGSGAGGGGGMGGGSVGVGGTTGGSAGSGAASTGGSNTTGGSSGSVGSPGSPSGTSTTREGGCGCRTSRSSNSRAPLGMTAILFGALLRRRRTAAQAKCE